MKRAAVVLMGVLALPLFAQRDFSEVEIKVHPVAGKIYMLEGAGGNIGVSAGEDGIVIIDDQYAPLAPKIKAALAGIVDAPVRFVINTHYHGDHTGGNEIFGESAPIIAHTNVRKRMQQGTPAFKIPPAAEGALPVITFDDAVSVHFNGEEIRAVHFPHGHTDGDSVIWFTGSNVVHMGDNFFAGVYPFIDIEGGGSVRGLIANLDRILPTLPDDVKIIPGHGPLSNRKELQAYREMLVETSAIVEQGVREGKTAEELKEAKVLSKYDRLSWNFINSDRFLDILYRDLSR